MNDNTVERVAKLFSAGEYPDRGIEVTEDDLEFMVKAHQPAPIKVEHSDTPFKIGTLTKIWRVGKELFGKLIFSRAAWDLIRDSGARGLSVAIKRDKSALTEVSIVRSPRVADAVLFGGDTVEFSIELDEESEDMIDTKVEEFSNRISELERLIAEREVESLVDSLKRAGKLAPASEELARALLASGNLQVVTFSDGSQKPVSQVFREFLEAQPKIIEFSELAKGSSNEALSDEEQEFYAKLGIVPESVGKYR